MPSPKEKPKGAKTKKSTGKAAARSQPAISAKQAAKLLKDKYVQQLDQRQPESGSTVAQAVGTVNMAYNSRLELLQAGDYDTITLDGQTPDWADVLAVFAVKTAEADVDGLDVATLDPDRVSRLTAAFGDMTGITVSEETVDNPASGTTAAWSEKILHITIMPRTADDMLVSYTFSEHQNSALDELLSDRAAQTSLAWSLAITSADVREVLDALPDDLDPARRQLLHRHVLPLRSGLFRFCRLGVQQQPGLYHRSRRGRYHAAPLLHQHYPGRGPAGGPGFLPERQPHLDRRGPERGRKAADLPLCQRTEQRHDYRVLHVRFYRCGQAGYF